MSYRTYKEYRDAEQKAANDLPLFFAFSRDQFRAEMEKRGLTEHDTDQIYPFGNTGGYYLRSDAPIIHEWLNRKDKLPALMENFDFAVDAFFYEMCNHEYGINWQGDWDVCRCFGDPVWSEEKAGADYLREMGYTDTTIKAYAAAAKKYHKAAYENEWF